MYEFLVGLEVTDSEAYSIYRAKMKPILASYGGGFGFDFVVSDVLVSEVGAPINRVFTIHFPSKANAETFFSDSEYMKVKARFFDASVSNTTIISNYEKNMHNMSELRGDNQR